MTVNTSHRFENIQYMEKRDVMGTYYSTEFKDKTKDATGTKQTALYQ